MELKKARGLVRLGLMKWYAEPIFFGFDDIPGLQKCIAEKMPFIFADHAYFDRGYVAGNFRVIRNDIHQRVLKNRPGPRILPPPMRDWKRGDRIVVFPPSYSIAKCFDTKAWTSETVAEIKKHTDRPVVIKKKDEGVLREYLHNCHAVVGYGTVASVESALMGIPVFCGPHCPATPIGLTDLSQIESPIYPDRMPWFSTLTWSQVHLSEIASGKVREVLDGP